DKILLRKRSVIESANDELKNMAQIEHSRHRSVANFLTNTLAAIAAYCYFPKKPSLNIVFDNEDKQLVLF
ncbi:MAG: IS982 family transposase, partial [Paludibacteraceae bacterium]|nr:IS982 family transposase [Paludibacteraceae bacterium]